MADALLQPLTLGSFTLQNRLIMAPLTRCRSTADHVPTTEMIKYYADRSSFGVIVSEATQIEKGYATYGKEPGIYDAWQVRCWREIIDAVHFYGSLFHNGEADKVQHLMLTSASADAAGDTHTESGGVPAKDDEEEEKDHPIINNGNTNTNNSMVYRRRRSKYYSNDAYSYSARMRESYGGPAGKLPGSATGCVFFCQIAHPGRATVMRNLDCDKRIVSPSPIGITNHCYYDTSSINKKNSNVNKKSKYSSSSDDDDDDDDGTKFKNAHPPSPQSHKIPYPTPTEIPTKDIPYYVQLYATAAKNAMAAGFDGVQIHGAAGFLVDQFLRDSSNKRTDEYGGSIENRCRFLFEVVDAVVAAVGADRTSLRLSPLNTYNDMHDSDPEALTRYICKRLSPYKLAFLDVIRGDPFTKATGADVWARESYEGVLVCSMGFDIAEAEAAVREKKCDAVAFGVKALANPDLPERAAESLYPVLNEPRPRFFYSSGVEGYNDYPAMNS